MKKLIIPCLAVLLSACTGSIELNDPQEFPQDGTALEGVVMSVPEFVFDEIETRTTITPTQSGLSFAWKSGDEVGVYASRAMANFNITAISEDAKSATFDGGGFSLTQGASYLAFYPYNGAATDKTSVPVSFTNQTQSANSSTDHLGDYDYLVASTTATAADEAHFEFSHLGAIIRIGFTAPNTGTYSQLSVTSSDGNFITAGTVDLTAEAPSITSNVSSNSIDLKLGSEGISLTEGDTFYGYMVVAPVDMSSSTLTFTVRDSEGSVYISTLSGKNMKAGKAYAYNIGNNNLLSGDFSISATKKVKFTKSNLYWDGSSFKFEADQTYYPTSWDANHVGHFYWTSITEYQSGNSGYMPYAQNITASTAARSTSDEFFCGEKNKMSVELTPDLFALRADEWDYLVSGRTNAGDLSKYPVTVAGKENCLIIAPDSFTGTLQSSYTLEEVNSLSLVCLPTSGYRDGDSFSRGGTYGMYWSSTSDYSFKNSANGFWFFTNTIKTTSVSREQALGLRLVWFDESTRVDVTSVSLNKTVVILEKGGTETLTATIAPSNATDQAVTWTSSNTSVATVDASGKVTAVAAGTTYISATANNGKTASCRVSVNLLSGEFSVSATRKVKFTRGNLYWNGSTFMFEDNQTDYPTEWDAKHVGHFYWSKYASNSYAELWNNDYGSASDKFFCGEDNKITVEGVSGLFALTPDEWNYLLNTRKDADDFNKYGVSVTNNGTTYNNCLIIAPDGFEGELKASYTIDEIISLGLVCLPAAGVRYTYSSAYASEKSYTYLSNLGDEGNYWCPTISPSQSDLASSLHTTSYGIYLPSYSSRSRGQSIRLVVVSQ